MTNKRDVLSVITVTWNHREEMEPWLHAIRQTIAGLKTLRLEVIVVDNASADGTATYLQKELPNAIVLAQERNTGFALGCNIGLKAASGDYLMLLNPDAEITAKAAEAMVGFLRRHRKAGAIGCRLIHDDGKAQISHYPRFSAGSYLINQSIAYPLIEAVSKRLPAALPKKPRRVGGLMGSCIIVPRSVYTKIGGLEPAYFMYFEDADWCERIITAGYDVVFEPRVSMRHKQKGSSSRSREFTYRRVYRSAVEYGNRHLRGLSRLALDAAMLLDMGARLLVYTTLGLLSRDNSEHYTRRVDSTWRIISVVWRRDPNYHPDTPP